MQLEPGVPWTVPERAPIPQRLEGLAPADAGLQADALAAFDAYAFAHPAADPDRRFQRTNAVVILRHGQVVYERYDRGTTADTSLLTSKLGLLHDI